MLCHATGSLVGLTLLQKEQNQILKWREEEQEEQQDLDVSRLVGVFV